MAGYETRLVAVQQADEELQLLESGDTALDECLEKIREMMPLFPDARQTDWNGIITGKREAADGRFRAVGL